MFKLPPSVRTLHFCKTKQKTKIPKRPHFKKQATKLDVWLLLFFLVCICFFWLTWTFEPSSFFLLLFFLAPRMLEAHALDVPERVRLSSGGYEWATAARPAGQYGQLMNEVEIIKINHPGDTTQRVPPPPNPPLHPPADTSGSADLQWRTPCPCNGAQIFFFWSTSLLTHACSDWLYFLKPKGLHSA